MTIITKIIYGLLFGILLILPHIFTGHIFGIPSPYIQNVITTFVLIFAFLIYSMHHDDVNKREQEKCLLNEKLIDSFKEIGVQNLRLPLLQNLTTDLLSSLKNTRQGRKDLFERLLATASVSIGQVHWGMFRFVDTNTQRTLREFVYTHQDYILPTIHIGNKDLLNYKTKDNQTNLPATFTVICNSSEDVGIKCFLILPQTVDVSTKYKTLKAISDQAQLFYSYLYKAKKPCVIKIKG